jgi:hypothetical protein
MAGSVYDFRTKKLVVRQMSGIISAGGIFGGGVTDKRLTLRTRSANLQFAGFGSNSKLSTFDFGSRGHFEEEIHSGKIENQIRSKRSERRRHLTHSAHRLQQPRQRKVCDSDRKPYR